jgi:hypothetical protein
MSPSRSQEGPRSRGTARATLPAMTPRQADIAFVVESLPGVTAVFAIDPTRRAAAHFDFAIKLEPGGRIFAAVHYALLRVLTHEECARVFVIREELPAAIAEAARPLVLTDSEREAARRRVPPAPSRQDIVSERPVHDPNVLIVDDDAHTETVVRAVLAAPARWAVFADVDPAVKLASTGEFGLILCAASRAFGPAGLLAKLPLDDARRVLVLADPGDVVLARSRLQSRERILIKPLEGWILRDRINRAGTSNLLSVPNLAKVLAPLPPRRARATPPESLPFSVLLVDVDDEVHEALRRVFREDARHMMRRDPGEAAKLALSTPFHFIACSANAALHPRSFLDLVAAEDDDCADRVVVLAPARDVPYVKHKLRHRRKNRVLPLPVEDTLLRREVFRDHPTLAALVAVAEVAGVAAARARRPKFRRIGVLVVDDDLTTEILAAAAAPYEEADVAFAATTTAAFEHVMSRAVDLLVVSATMRADGGEPFYRVLWRLKPELKSRSVLVTPDDLAPPSVRKSQPPRVVERPLTRDAIGKLVQAFAQR